VRDNLHRIIEAILFASDTPITQQKFKELISGTGVKDIRDAIDYLNRQYEDGGSALKIIELAGGYQLVTREEYAPFLQKLYKGRASSRLTQRALETLSIVAYKQPITKQEIEAIRGVNVDAVMKTLLERNLITIEGRQKAPGSPLLYGTTKFFLEYFALKSLEALPTLKEIDELLKADDKFLESLDQVALEKLAPESLGIKNPEVLVDEAQNQKEQSGAQIPLIVFENVSDQETTENKSLPEDNTQSPESMTRPAGSIESKESSEPEQQQVSGSASDSVPVDRVSANGEDSQIETEEPVKDTSADETINTGEQNEQPGTTFTKEKNNSDDAA